MDPSHEVRVEYLNNKRKFRQAMRTLQKEQDMAFYQDLELQCSDLTKLFPFLSPRMGTHCELSGKITVNGVEYADENILEGWAKHFQELGTPETDGFNETFKTEFTRN